MGVVHGGANSPSGPIEITIADNGPGIPPEVRPKIFDPFFSGREAGRGLGFGLSKAWRIVTMHGGTIDVRATPGGGATFVITLPAATQLV
jgi:signal transduction histidine kinase